MTQESTMICIDNSEWMRNGDLPPTRFNCQQEAVRALIHYKLRSNPENAVGLLSLANRIEVLNSLLTDDRKLMVRLHSLEINGSTNVLSGLKTAYLALKHRKNRNHRMRIIVFIGSPLGKLLQEKELFIKFAKKLKKEKVNADFVLFGEATSEDNQIVSDFVGALNGADGQGSHLLVVPAGDTKLYDALLRSPICEGAGGANLAAGGDFGINEEDDPELAMALRISLEEQRLRQQHQGGGDGHQEERAAAVAQPQAMEVGNAAVAENEPDGVARPTPPLVQAPKTPSTAAAVPSDSSSQQTPPINFEDMSEEDQMAYALRMSMDQTGDGQQRARSRSPSMAMSTPAPTPMEVEEDGGEGGSGRPVAGAGVVGDLLNDPTRLQQLVDQQGKLQQSQEVSVTHYSTKSEGVNAAEGGASGRGSGGGGGGGDGEEKKTASAQKAKKPHHEKKDEKDRKK